MLSDVRATLMFLVAMAASSTQAVRLGPLPCENFYVKPQSASEAMVTWEDPLSGLPSTGFLIHCRPVGGTWTLLAGRKFFDHSLTYSGLSEGTTYQCRCRAWSSEFSDPKSKPVYDTFTVPTTGGTGKAGDPMGLKATGEDETTMFFEWNPPVSGGAVDGYEVAFRTGSVVGVWGAWQLLATAQQPQVETSLALSSIEAGTFVQVRVRSVNGEGVTKPGSWEIAQRGGASGTTPTWVGTSVRSGTWTMYGTWYKSSEIPCPASVEVNVIPVGAGMGTYPFVADLTTATDAFGDMSYNPAAAQFIGEKFRVDWGNVPNTGAGGDCVELTQIVQETWDWSNDVNGVDFLYFVDLRDCKWLDQTVSPPYNYDGSSFSSMVHSDGQISRYCFDGTIEPENVGVFHFAMADPGLPFGIFESSVVLSIDLV